MKFHGKKTASGEVFDKSEFTAAHPSLPFGSKVRVTKLVGNSSVEVEINDRGPFGAGRIIDLSHAAAEALGMVEEGTAGVRGELISLPNEPGNPVEAKTSDTEPLIRYSFPTQMPHRQSWPQRFAVACGQQ